MKNLVIVDDNLMMREFLSNYFSSSYRVTIYESAEQAITGVQGGELPDVMLIDYELSGISGYQLLKTLKTSGFYNSIPIIFLSGKAKSDAKIQCLKEGAFDFVTKPFNPVELSYRINKSLNYEN
ncbi:MAG: response regulator [Cyclobacteriaceae bacterium]